ncbi:potential N-terminal peptidyl-methionine acetyltransferase [Pseudozyma hubeiensis SY62]|uniref:Potential N-terminal peptidyl-methionine acetyltransferase n=1 Tax=Pseudozyma hubeiensis (strain SY62) TaxID=1305764 RepID=R9PHC5_PSEHS|nr:potential N-terminal peptidyl-methionine acetyltransferase [Pseudozyma hubeiensis SY62]GAC97500.1 potential N-terminal peptidyl-methionine acetyltransferase [Pseudozyma hubeiensis SY62]
MKMALRGLLAAPLRGVSRTPVRVAAAAARVGSSSSSSSSRLSFTSRSLHQQRVLTLDSTPSHSLLFKPASAYFASASPIILSSRSISTTSSTSNTSSSSKPSSTPPPRPEPEAEDTDSPPPKATLRERLKFLTRRYGWWALGVYLLASSVDFSLTFLAIHLLGADHIRSLEASLRKSIGLEQRSEDPDESSKSGNKSSTIWTEAVLAYTIHKTLLLPVRVAFTAAVTPSFVKWLVKMGWAKANHQVKASVGRKAADKAIQDVVRRNNAVKKVEETAKHQ